MTPKGVVAHTDTDSVQAPGELGEFELLPGHVPMLTALKPGVLTIGTKARARYAVSSGYLRVDPRGRGRDPRRAGDAGEGRSTPRPRRSDLATAEAELAKWGDKAAGRRLRESRRSAPAGRARVSTLSRGHPAAGRAGARVSTTSHGEPGRPRGRPYPR